MTHEKRMRRLRRSMMFLNAQRPALIKDAYIYKPDSLMLDLEDAVAENQKDAARFSLYNALKSVDYRGVERIVRTVRHSSREQARHVERKHFRRDIHCRCPGAELGSSLFGGLGSDAQGNNHCEEQESLFHDRRILYVKTPRLVTTVLG